MFGSSGSMAWVEILRPRRALEVHRRDPIAAAAEVHGAAEAPVVLHRSVHTERRVHVIRDVEELRERERQARVLPRRAPVVGDGEPLVVHVDEVTRVVGIDPEAVVIAAGRLEPLEGLSAIVRDVQA